LAGSCCHFLDGSWWQVAAAAAALVEKQTLKWAKHAVRGATKVRLCICQIHNVPMCLSLASECRCCSCSLQSLVMLLQLASAKENIF